MAALHLGIYRSVFMLYHAIQYIYHTQTYTAIGALVVNQHRRLYQLINANRSVRQISYVRPASVYNVSICIV